MKLFSTSQKKNLRFKFFSILPGLPQKSHIKQNRALKRELKLANNQSLDQLSQLSEIYSSEVDEKLREFIFKNAFKSQSQLFQDLVVLYHNPIFEGYFVEFGASDGIHLSNTYLLEHEYGWQGILAEPGKVWREDLRRNRKAKISELCVSSHSRQKLVFNDTIDPMLSTIDKFSGVDHWAESRSQGKKYFVESISLNDLLSENNSPSVIDYLSIDTEGSEYSILANLDFDKYKFNFISVEHNYSEQRELILQLLVSKSYRRILVEISRWDDWYIRI
jgi:FkbM family methyltransferase